jgi:carbonic anhydrase
MTPVRLAALVLPAALLALPAFALAEPVDKPAPRHGPKGAAPAARATAGPASAVPAPAAEVDPMDRLRARLAERLATPGAPPASGTLDLQVGTRSSAPGHGAAKPVAGGGAHGGGHGGAHGGAVAQASAHGPSAQEIARGDAEGIAWTRPPGAAPTHRVSAHPDPAPAAAAAHAPAARRALGAPTTAGKGHGAAGASGHAAHWAYEGAAGPAAWGALKPEFGLCANGQRQSPIDIRGGLPVDLEPVKFDYRPSAFSVIDNGHTVQVNMPPGNAIEVGGRRYELVQFHFHRPSEERIDGRQFEMSLHLVHKDPTGRLAVVGVLLGKGPAHPAVQAVWNNLPLERNEEAPARAEINPSHLLPEDRRYFTYMGSLTTPPCSEGVQWVVMRTPVTVTPEQIELFARIYPMNARPAQPVAGRRIMQSQ